MSVNRTYSQVPVRPGGVRRPPVPPEPTRSSGLIRRWFTRLCGAAVFVVIAGMVLQGVMALSAKPVAQVLIEGEFEHVTREQVAARVYEAMDNSFIRMDLQKIQAFLEQEPWIYQVNVTRRWPDTLIVRVVEQQPIARWGTDGFLNQRGQIVRTEFAEGLTHLPLLWGPEEFSAQVMTRYQLLARLVRKEGLTVTGVRADNGLSWSLTLGNGVEVKLGRDQVVEKMARFLTVYRVHLKEHMTGVAGIDVRYSNGVAVNWKPRATGAEQNENKTPAGTAG